MSKKKISKKELQELSDAVVTSARAGGKVLLRYHRARKFDTREKQDAGLVTNADLDSERAVLKILRKARPDFGFLSEEQEPFAGGRGRWIIDPLDGTTNFVHAFPMFCVSVAAEWEGEVVAGAIYHPIFNDLYVAVRGQGAFLNGKRIRVSKTQEISSALLATGFYTYSRRDQKLKIELEAFERLSRLSRGIRRAGSAALDLAYTARGVFDGFWERKLSPWDVAAGGLLVLEAGGRVSDFRGNPFAPDAGQIIAANKHMHPQILQAVAPEHCVIDESRI